jgi:hypothetical protein
VPGLGQQPLKSVRGTERATVRASVAAPPILLGPGGEEIRLSWESEGPEARGGLHVAGDRTGGPWRRTACLLYVLRTLYKDAVNCTGYGVMTREHGERPKDERSLPGAILGRGLSGQSVAQARRRGGWRRVEGVESVDTMLPALCTSHLHATYATTPPSWEPCSSW